MRRSQRKVLLRRGGNQLSFIANARDGGDAAHDCNALARKELHADAARNAQRRGESSGKMPAARAVLIAAVFYLGGVIRVAGARRKGKVFIVLRPCVRVADDGRKRRAAGAAVHKP